MVSLRVGDVNILGRSRGDFDVYQATSRPQLRFRASRRGRFTAGAGYCGPTTGGGPAGAYKIMSKPRKKSQSIETGQCALITIPSRRVIAADRATPSRGVPSFMPQARMTHDPGGEEEPGHEPLQCGRHSR
jgi:hypothetical protein